jgi:hypothetical protein
MKKRIINAIIAKKINEWLGSIKDESVRKSVEPDIVVSGGCIVSMLLNEEVNDFDIYLKTKASLKALCEYYCRVFNQNNKGRTTKIGTALHAWVLDGQDVEEWKQGAKELSSFAYGYDNWKWSEVQSYVPSEHDKEKTCTHRRLSNMLTNVTPDRIKVMVNSDGVAEDSDSLADKVEYGVAEYLDALGDGDSVKASITEPTSKDEKYKPVFLSTNAITLSGRIQIVCRFYGDPDEIHKNYDYIHATNYWTPNTKCVLNMGALEAILNKELKYVGSRYPICSLIRARKFIKRGWTVNAGQFVKMSFQISKLNLGDINVLEDQLVGVDSVYFLSFIKAMQEKMLEDPAFGISQEYLTTVIDRIFG